MWKCQQCGEEVEDTYDVCWNCSTGKDGTPFQENLYKRAHDLHYISQDFDGAMELYEQIIEQFPESPEAQRSRTEIRNIEQAKQRQQSTQAASTEQDAASSPVGQPVMSRYTDAYRVARATTAIGDIVKVIGVILAVIILVVGLGIASQSGEDMMGIAAVPLAIVIGVPFYVLGILVSALGQILKAILDATVTSSPFLTEEQMKKVMSL